MPPDGLAGHLEVDGVFVLVVGLGYAQERDMAAYGIEHDAVGKQLHADEVRLLGVKADSSQGVLQLTEAGLDIPAHVVQVFHAFDGELEPVQVRNQDFPLFLAGSRVIDAELYDAALDRAELLEVPTVVDRVFRVILRVGLAHGVDQVQVRVGLMYLGVKMVRCRDPELYLDVAFLAGQFLDFLDVPGFRPDDVIRVQEPIERLEHVETGIAPVHNNDERVCVVQALRHVDGSVALVGLAHSLDDTVLVRPVHQVE